MKINVTHSSMPPFEEYCEEIRSIWDTVHLTNMGPIHERLASGVREYLGVSNVELFANGHLALYSALRALGVTGEVITTPFTFASTTNAIVQCGCTPVFCDVKPDYTIDENKIEALITDRTSAILAVHVYGNICAVDKIQRIADRHGLRVIYDAAHAFGVRYKGRSAAQFGDASMFSFHATKVFHTIEGGCVAYDDPALTEKLALERNFGVSGEELKCFGMNAKMNEFEAAMGICNLRHLDEELSLRGAVFERYCERLDGVPGLTITHTDKDTTPNFAYYPVLVAAEVYGCGRDALMQRLAEHDVSARKYFYPLTSENRAFGQNCECATPAAKYYSENILCLPMYAHLEKADVDRICDIIIERK